MRSETKQTRRATISHAAFFACSAYSSALMPARAETLSARAFAALAVLLPMSLLLLHADRGHAGDIEFFHRWYGAVRAGNDFYAEGPGINYPIVGVLLVSAPALLVDRITGHALTLGEYTLVLKTTLVIGEVALIAAAANLARALEHPRPRTLAILLYLLPCTWAGGAYFGQIDVWGTALLLACAERAIAYRKTGSLPALCFALAALMLALLTKQLTLFCAPALAAAIALGLRAHARPSHWATIALAPPILVLADPLLTLPPGYLSHLHFVLAHGSSHGELVVASGASLWSLIAVGGTPSSSLVWLGLDAQRWGWIAFTLALAAIALATTSAIRTAPGRTRDRATDRALVRAAGLSQLAMALLLTGVHERYLTLAIPLLVLADSLAFDQAHPRRTLRSALAALVATSSGLFVLSTIEPTLEELPVVSWPAPTALLALAWALSLLWPRPEARPAGADSSA